jgi:hypothetical protein
MDLNEWISYECSYKGIDPYSQYTYNLSTRSHQKKKIAPEIAAKIESINKLLLWRILKRYKTTINAIYSKVDNKNDQYLQIQNYNNNAAKTKFLLRRLLHANN